MDERLCLFFEELDEYYMDGDLRGLEQFLLKRKEEFLQEQPIHALIVYNELGAFYRSIHQYGKSLDEYEQAKNLVEQELGRTTQYAEVVNNMAGTCRLMGDYTRALSLFKEAQAIYQECGMDQGYQYTSLLNNMALVHRQMGQKMESKNCLTQALRLLKNMPECQMELAATYNNLIAMHSASGEMDDAMCWIHCALADYEKCPEEEKIYYAAALNSMGAFLFSQRHYDQALNLYRRSLKLTKKVFGENEEYANTSMNLFWVYKEINKPKEAKKMIEKAYQIYVKLFGEYSEKAEITKDLMNRNMAPFHQGGLKAV